VAERVHLDYDVEREIICFDHAAPRRLCLNSMIGPQMKSVFFGNPNTDWWKLSLDDISVREKIVALNGELEAGFFHASTPMCIAPEVLSQFAADLRELDRTLTGSATLESRNRQSGLRFTLTVDHVGHVHAVGRYEINGNTLDFTFCSDQTTRSTCEIVGWRRCRVSERSDVAGR